MDIGALLILLFVGLITFLFVKSCRRPEGMPLGPTPWPIVGNLPQILKHKNIVEAFRDFRKQYGDIFSVKLGSTYVVVVNGYDNLRDALLRGDRFDDRANNTIFKTVLNCEGILGSSGRLWSESRLFAQNTLKTFGFGKHSLQDKIMKETNLLLQYIEGQEGKNINISPIFQGTFSNIMALILYSRRHGYEDEYMGDLRHKLKAQATESEFTGIVDILPFLAYVPGDMFRIKRLVANERSFDKHFQKEVEEHKRAFDDSDHRDFIDVYLSEMEKRKDDPTSIFTERQLLRVCRDLLLAATDTTATILTWTFLHLVFKPEIQDNMYKEIVEVIGTSRQPDMTDKPKMPYCDAVCYESLRLGNVTPLSGPRSTTGGRDVEFKGYKIPGGTHMYPCIDSILFDENIFPDPEEFVPERFFDGASLKIDLTKTVITFALGKRNCLGEVLARQELFLTLISLVQRFKLLPPKDMPTPENKRLFGFVFHPAEYYMRFEMR